MFLIRLSYEAMNKDQWDPEFLKAIPIMKTRSGMQVRLIINFSTGGDVVEKIYILQAGRAAN